MKDRFYITENNAVKDRNEIMTTVKFNTRIDAEVHCNFLNKWIKE